MNRGDAATLIRRYLDENGLTEWCGRFMNAKTILGRCNYAKKLIELSNEFVRLNTPERVELTVIHEVAHALHGPGEIVTDRYGRRRRENPHGPRWQKIARDLGHTGPGRVTAARVAHTESAPRRWYATCPSCGDRVITERHILKPAAARRLLCGRHRLALIWHDRNLEPIAPPPTFVIEQSAIVRITPLDQHGQVVNPWPEGATKQQIAGYKAAASKRANLARKAEESVASAATLPLSDQREMRNP
jgi:predicted SprT family Zn-dependent metalloprotease